MPAQINNLAAGRYFEKLCIRFPQSYARQFEILCSDPGVLKLAAEVDAQLRRVPVLMRSSLSLPITPGSTTVVSRVPSASKPPMNCLPRSSRLLPSVGLMALGVRAKRGRRIRLHLADVFIGFADIKLMRNRAADLSLRDYRLMLSVGWHQQTTLLKNAACAITRDGPVIHQRNSAPIGQHANGFGGQCGAERSVWYRWNKNTD